MKEFKGLPGIKEYLAARGDNCPVEVQELEHMEDALVAYCALTKDQSQRILSLFFQEVRSSMLNGDVVDIRGLGSFFVSSPATTRNTKKVFPKFQPKQSFLKRLNHDRT
jgi:nucleoid DNA-binding protein